MENKSNLEDLLACVGVIGELMYMTYKSFLNAGFTEIQAMELTKTCYSSYAQRFR